MTVPNGSCICDKECFHSVWSLVGATVVVKKYLHMQQSPIGAVIVVRGCFHSVWSPVGAASVVKKYLHI
jgi:hypothetical protein